MATFCCSRTRASTRARRRTIRPSSPSSPKLGDLYVNDAFSAAHRAHATTEGARPSAARLRRPHHAGRAAGARSEALDHPAHPVMAIVGGAKISTKLELLGNLIRKVDSSRHRRRHGQYFPRRAGQAGRQIAVRARSARQGARHSRRGADIELRDRAADRRDGGAEIRGACALAYRRDRACRRERHDPRRRAEDPSPISRACSRRPRRWSGTARSAPSSCRPSTRAPTPSRRRRRG